MQYPRIFLWALLTLVLPAQAGAASIHFQTDFRPASTRRVVLKGADLTDAPDQNWYWSLDFAVTDWLPWESREQYGEIYYLLAFQSGNGSRTLHSGAELDRLWTPGSFRLTALPDLVETGPVYLKVVPVGGPPSIEWRSWLAEGVEDEYVDGLMPYPFLHWNADLSTEFASIQTVLAHPHYEFTLVAGEIPEPGAFLPALTGLLLLPWLRAASVFRRR